LSIFNGKNCKANSNAPCASSRMNRPIQSWLLLLCQKESLYGTIYMETYATVRSCNFMLNVLHLHSFLKRGIWQLGSRSQVSIRAKWPIRPALILEVTGSIPIFPWMICLSMVGLLPALNLHVPQPGLEPRLLEIQKKHKSKITGCCKWCLAK